MVVLSYALLALGCAALVPALVLLVECLAASATARAAPRPASSARAVVVVPAHDEEAAIAATCAALLPQLGPADRLLVVADNCTDRTAEVARAAGASVIERVDPDHRGKGLAIAFAVQHLSSAPPDAVVLVDADCRVAPADGLRRLVEQALALGRPVQAEYLLGSGERPSPRNVMSALAILVRNRVRPRGLARLGLPCQLTGSGMAMPWPVLAGAPSTGTNLVEDLVMGLELALRGTPPAFCPEVSVSSELPDQDRALYGQRKRWEHGQLATLVAYGPRLVARGLLGARLPLLALGLDLVVPPLALFVMLLALGLLASATTWLLGGSPSPLAAFTAAMAAVALSVTRAWWAFARDTVPARYLLVVPLYVAWKVPLYVGLALKGKQKRWERTQRKGENR